MNFDWHKFLYAGQYLAGYAPDEPLSEDAELRIAVILLYYSAFRLTRNYLRDYHGFSVSFGYGNHSDVFRELERLNISQLSTLATLLKQLKKWRESANYDDVYRFGYLPDKIADIVYDAEKAVAIIDRLSKP
jgi:hypothetical protein